jgi:hypothetical protein
MSKNVGLKRVISEQLFTFYRKRVRSKTRRIVGRKNYTKVAKEILSTIQKNIIEKEGGVMINNFGYFFVFRIPAKQISVIPGKNGEEDTVVSNYDFVRYTISFQPIRKFQEWHMTGIKHYKLRKGVSKKLKSGFYYKNYLSTLQKMKIL